MSASKYRKRQTVTFEHNSKRSGGEIVAVDHRGGAGGATFYDPEEWTYDVQAADCPYKHIPEQNIIG